MADFVRHTSCSKCGSTDGNALYSDGSTFCFVCKKLKGTNEIEIPVKEKRVIPLTPLTDVFRDFKQRGLSSASVKRYGVDVDVSANDTEARYPLFSNGVHVANKVRRKDKHFHYEGTADKLELFGQHAFPAGSAKYITVVEGQDDALAAFELTGFKFPCVSVLSSGTAVDDCKRNYEYLDSFPEIVICFDKDEAKVNPLTGEKSYPGQEAALKVAGLFKPGKVRVLTLRDYKDPNDYLRANKAAQFVKEWWAAPQYKPDGIKIGTQMWDEIINRPNHFSVAWPFEKLQKMTYGIRLSELILVHAPTGIGKTSIIKEVEYKLLTDAAIVEKGYGVGFLHLEEPNHDTALGLMSIHNDKPYHLPDTERTVEELKTAYDAVINTDRVVIYDHFGSNNVEAILDKVRHMVALGCKYIVIDHLSIIVSDQSGDERKQLDEISTKLKTITMELNIACICVIHQNRQGMVRGTAGVEQVSNIVIRLERDKTAVNDWRRNVMKTVVEKNRFSGTTGPASYMFYQARTGRLEELEDEEILTYESGEEIRDDQMRF